MKKKYTAPAVIVTKCQLEGIIAASPTKEPEQQTPAAGSGDSSGTTGIPEAGSGDGQKAKEHYNAWTAWED